MSKTHFVAVTPDGHKKEFKRHVFRLLNNDYKVLIHYIGDESVACEFPHGNSKSDTIFHRSCPSVLNKISTSHDSPEVMYKNLVSNSKCPPSYQPYLLPRNSKQVSNVQYKARQKFHLSHDAIYNLHEIAYDLGTFVKKLSLILTLLSFLNLSGCLKSWTTFSKLILGHSCSHMTPPFNLAISISPLFCFDMFFFVGLLLFQRAFFFMSESSSMCMKSLCRSLLS